MLLHTIQKINMNTLTIERDVPESQGSAYYNPLTRYHIYNGYSYGLNIDLYGDGQIYKIVHNYNNSRIGHSILGLSTQLIHNLRGMQFGEKIECTKHINYKDTYLYSPEE